MYTTGSREHSAHRLEHSITVAGSTSAHRLEHLQHGSGQHLCASSRFLITVARAPLRIVVLLNTVAGSTSAHRHVTPG